MGCKDTGQDKCPEEYLPDLEDGSSDDTKDNTLPGQVFEKRTKCTFYFCTINISVIIDICNFCNGLNYNAADKKSIKLG